jgi:hypothetical protein
MPSSYPSPPPTGCTIFYRVRALSRIRRLYCGSSVSAAPAWRHDPLLHGVDKVVGFGRQFIKALIPPPREGPDSAAA